MIITIEPPLGLQVADIKVSLKLKPAMVFALFFGYIVLEGTMPAEIGKALDDLEEKDIPDGWKIVTSMWRSRNITLDAREICDVISPWLKEAL